MLSTSCRILLGMTLGIAIGIATPSLAPALEAQVLWQTRPPVQTVEIAALDKASSTLFVTTERGILSVRLVDGVTSRRLQKLPAGFHATSVAASEGRIAVALATTDKRLPGRIDLFETSSLESNALKPLATFTAGHHPDMVCFSPDGQFLVAANEGEPTDDYDFDGTGSVTVVDLAQGLAEPGVSQCSFYEFDGKAAVLRSQGVRLFGPSKVHPDGHATVSEDLEPEYIACSQDGRRAWVTLQENNAIAEIDLRTAKVVEIHALGEKDFRHMPEAGTKANGVSARSATGYSSTGLDASDQDDHLQAQLWPVKGSFEPDAIAHFSDAGIDYLVTANEGDPRDYVNYHEAAAAADLTICGLPGSSRPWDQRAPARHLLQPNQLGRLQVSIEECDPDHDGDVDELHAFGTRSFSVWRASGTKLELVFDSGSDFERLLALWAKQQTKPVLPFDSRSHIRGPEPEGVVLGQIAGRRYAFIGLERASGIMVYDLTRPTHPKYCCYIPPAEEAGIVDASPEGLVFVPAKDSPTKRPLLVVCNEYSGTITAYQLATSAVPR